MSVMLQFKLTSAGQAASFNATNTGFSLNLTHVQVGSGNKVPTGLETALVSPVAAVGIASGFAVSASQIRMTAVFTGSASFTVREVGLWSGVPGAVGSVLVCYWSQAEGDLIVKANGVDFVFSHDMIIDAAVSPGSLNVISDPTQSAVLAMIAIHEQHPNPHPQYATRAVCLSGNKTTYVNQVKTFSITNYDVFSTYTATASAGSVSLSGDVVTYTAPATAGNVTFTINVGSASNTFQLNVLATGVATPSITSPSVNATGVNDAPTVTSSAFSWSGVSDTHANSDWQLATDAAFANVVQSSTASTTNKTSWTLGALTVNTTYYLRVRHTGANNGTSGWSTAVSFTTAYSFTSYIPTPTATPAIGTAFEGGFYVGMIWNELVQSTSSITIGTGSKSFSVANMTGAPIVYAGQALEVRSRANPSNKMVGTVTGASGTVLTINVASVGGSGTFSDWSIMAKYRIIVAPKASGEHSGLNYKASGYTTPADCTTLTEGRKATLAMVAAGSSAIFPAAHFCNNLSIGSKTDWYLPARDELELCWRNLKPTTDPNYVTADRPVVTSASNPTLGSYGDSSANHGNNNNSSPTGTSYLANNPGHTSVVSFQTGGSEAFTYGSAWYWSSSAGNDTYGWSQGWFGIQPGMQNTVPNASSYRVRAIRRSII